MVKKLEGKICLHGYDLKILRVAEQALEDTGLKEDVQGWD